MKVCPRCKDTFSNDHDFCWRCLKWTKYNPDIPEFIIEVETASNFDMAIAIALPIIGLIIGLTCLAKPKAKPKGKLMVVASGITMGIPLIVGIVYFIIN